MTKRKPKRANNAGSVSQRKDGRWQARLLVGYDENGKPARRTFYGKTREEAENKLLEAMHQHRRGLLLEPSRQTLGEYLTAWLEDCVKGSVAPKTYRCYEQVVRVHLVPGVGSVKLTKLTPQHVQRLYREKGESGLSPRMVQLIHAVLHRALNQAVKWSLVHRNVTDAVDKPRVTRHEMRFLSPEEADRFLDAAQDDRLYAMYVLAITCGLRQGELLGSRWDDVNFDKGTLKVQRQLQYLEGEPQLVDLKTARSRRSMMLPAVTIAALKKHRIRQKEERLKLMGTWPDWDLAFTTIIGTPLDASSIISRSFHRILEKAGLPRIRFHDMRHTCATLLLAQGEHPKIVQEMMGHSTITLTMDTYSHVTPSMQKQAADRMDAILLAAKAKRR